MVDIKNILRVARTNDNIGSILLNVEDYYSLLDSNALSRIDPVTRTDLLEQGLVGHVDGFAIFATKTCPTNSFALAKKDKYNSDVIDVKAVVWKQSQATNIPLLGQRYQHKHKNFIAEVHSINYHSNYYNYLIKMKVVQTLNSNMTISSCIDEYSLEQYEYLIGQDKPIT